MLQNDSGNYKLKNSELTPNFIPVGIKEHSNIIYIVSYNPLTKETEVGSYPSPEVMQTTKDGGDIELIPLIEKPSQALVKISNINTYNNLRNEYKYVNISDLDMYPGDVYELQITDGENGESLSDLWFKYQTLNFYIKDESNFFTKVEMLQNFQSVANFNTFGKLYYRFEIPTFKWPNCAIKYNDMVADNNGKFNLNFDFNYSLYNSDLTLKSYIDETNVELKLLVELKENSDDNISEIITSFNSVSYNLDTLYIFSGSFNAECSIDNNYTLHCTPYIEYPTADGIYSIYYDDVSVTTAVGLSVEQYPTITIADLYYNYYINDDNLELYFNLSDSLGKVDSCRYTIYDLSSNLEILNGEINVSSDSNLYKSLVLSFNDLKKEHPYVIKFEAYIDSDLETTISKPLITSKAFNVFKSEYDDFSTISADIWVKNYITLNVDNVNYNINTSPIESKDWNYYAPGFEDLLSKSYKLDVDYEENDFFPELKLEKIQNSLFETIIYNYHKVNVDLNINNTVTSKSSGDLWSNLNDNDMFSKYIEFKINNTDYFINYSTTSNFDVDFGYYYPLQIITSSMNKGDNENFTEWKSVDSWNSEVINNQSYRIGFDNNDNMTMYNSNNNTIADLPVGFSVAAIDRFSTGDIYSFGNFQTYLSEWDYACKYGAQNNSVILLQLAVDFSDYYSPFKGMLYANATSKNAYNIDLNLSTPVDNTTQTLSNFKLILKPNNIFNQFKTICEKYTENVINFIFNENDFSISESYDNIELQYSGIVFNSFDVELNEMITNIKSRNSTEYDIYSNTDGKDFIWDKYIGTPDSKIQTLINNNKFTFTDPNDKSKGFELLLDIDEYIIYDIYKTTHMDTIPQQTYTKSFPILN